MQMIIININTLYTVSLLMVNHRDLVSVSTSIFIKILIFKFFHISYYYIFNDKRPVVVFYKIYFITCINKV